MSKHEQHIKARKARAYHVYVKRRELDPVVPEHVIKYGVDLRRKYSLYATILVLGIFVLLSCNFRSIIERVMPHKYHSQETQLPSQLSDVETIRFSHNGKLPRKPGRYVIYTATNSDDEHPEITEHINDGYVHPSSRVVNIDVIQEDYEYSSNDSSENIENDNLYGPEETSIHKPEKIFIGHSTVVKSAIQDTSNS